MIDWTNISETEKDLRLTLGHIEEWLGYDLRPVNSAVANRIAEIAGRVARGEKLQQALDATKDKQPNA